MAVLPIITRQRVVPPHGDFDFDDFSGIYVYGSSISLNDRGLLVTLDGSNGADGEWNTV